MRYTAGVRGCVGHPAFVDALSVRGRSFIHQRLATTPAANGDDAGPGPTIEAPPSTAPAWYARHILMAGPVRPAYRSREAG
jgi:hypothetical protein